jgi:hypothetical protein
MSAQANQFARRAPAAVNSLLEDRRRYKRVQLSLLGRFMRENKLEYPCQLLDISVGDCSVAAPVRVHLGERIVIYLDHLGGLEGVVSRAFDDGFSLTINATQHKREKLAAQLTWLVNRSELGGIGERRHERVVPRNASSSISLGEGLVVACRILDVSLSGASIATPARPPIGHEVVIGGKVKGKVVRHHEQGIAVEFCDLQSPSYLDRYMT